MEPKTLFTTVRFSHPANFTRKILPVMICFLVCLLFGQPIVAQSFSAVPLTHPDGSFNAVTINNLAQVAGTVIVNDSTYHAVRREQNGQYTNLPELGGNLSQAIGMNELGEVIGFTLDENGFGHVLVWESGGFRELEVPADASFLPIPLDLNNSGVVIGYYIDGSNLRHALVWDTNGVVQILPEDQGVQSTASAINEAGEIAGSILLADGTARAYLWQPNSSKKSILSTQLTDYTTTDIGTLGGAGAQALDINNQGQIVGMANFSPHSLFVHAFVWQDGVMVDLGTLGGDNSRANSINDDGIIVGRSLVSDSTATKSDRHILQQGLLSNVFENFQAKDMFFPVSPMKQVNAQNDEEYDAFLATFRRGVQIWEMTNLKEKMNGGIPTDTDDAISINLDRGFLTWDDADHFNAITSDLLYIDSDASGGSPGHHYSPYSSINAAFAGNVLSKRGTSVYLKDGVFQGGVTIATPRASFRSYRGFGSTLKHNPGNSQVVFVGRVAVDLGVFASFSGGQNDLRTFNDVVVNGDFKIKSGIKVDFREEISTGPEGKLLINSRKDKTNTVTINKGVMGEGSIHISGDGNTELIVDGDIEVKVEKEDDGQLSISGTDFSLSDFTMNGGSLLMQSDMNQSFEGLLVLEEGLIMLNKLRWTILNPNPEAIMGGGIDSYFTGGEVYRGIRSAGTYNFPVGDDEFYDPVSFRFGNDFPIEANLGVNHGNSEDFNLSFSGVSADVPSLGRNIMLDVLGHPAWEIKQDGSFPENPDLRLAPLSMRNIFNINFLHPVTFNSNGSFSGVAGEDPSLLENGDIEGVPNIFQPDVALNDGMFLGIASNRFLNPIDLPEGNFTRVQFVHLSTESPKVDIYDDDMNIHFPLNKEQATPFGALTSGNHSIDIVDANDQDNSNPIASENIDFVDQDLTIVFVPTVSDNSNMIKFEARVKATESDKVDINFINALPNIGSFDINVVVDGEQILLGQGIEFGNSSGYKTVNSGIAEIPLLGKIFEFDLNKREGESLLFFITPRNIDGKKSSLRISEDDYDLLVLDAQGLKLEPTEVTSVEESTLLPGTFSLHANYPNPFIHYTNISYELPQSSSVRLTVKNLVGQTVRSLVNTQQQAGYYTVELDGRDDDGKELTSGIYMYTIVAGNFIQTRTMMLIK